MGISEKEKRLKKKYVDSKKSKKTAENFKIHEDAERMVLIKKISKT